MFSKSWIEAKSSEMAIPTSNGVRKLTAEINHTYPIPEDSGYKFQLTKKASRLYG